MEEKTCQNCKKSFSVTEEDLRFYDSIHVPPSTWCPECRMIRRFMFRNERFSFRRTNDVDGTMIFSGIPPQAEGKVFDVQFWNSDGWDAMEFGYEYDMAVPFFEQFRSLLLSVPKPSKSAQRMVNSDYCDQASDMKNSYLCFNGGAVEDSAYTVKAYYIKNSFDLYEAMHNEFCYDSLMVDDCYKVFFSLDCEASQDIWFSKDLGGCTNCFGCVGLRNKSYYIFNQPYSKEEYFEKLKTYTLDSWRAVSEMKKKAHDFWNSFPVKYMHGTNNNAVQGEHIQNSRKVTQSYSVHDGENLKYCQMVVDKTFDSYDYSVWGDNSSLMYESVVCGEQCRQIKFSWECWPSSFDLEYCAYCRSSSNLFGCVGLKKKSYCILNRQYSKEEYFALREKIINHMNTMPYRDTAGRIYRYGEFFPPEFSLFAYNETMAQDFFPHTKDTAQHAGVPWREPESREFKTTIDAHDLPGTIHDTTDTILKEMIKCFSCARAYRIIPMEYEFYKKMQLPLPRNCSDCRFRERFRFVNPPRLWRRSCQCAGDKDIQGVYHNLTSHAHASDPCPNEFDTSYAPECRDIVYCESCYNNEVVG